MKGKQENRTKLGKRLLAFGPELDVFEVHAREVAARITNAEPLLQALLKDWPDAPLIFNAEAQQPQTLSWRDRSKEGYSGPRSTYVFARSPVATPFEKAEAVFERIVNSGSTRLTIVYPNRMNNVNFLHDFLNLSENLGKKLGLEIISLPIYKMEGSARRTDANDRISLGIRFWSPSPPPVDSDYLIADTIISGGRTLEAIRSFLKEHGVEDKKVKAVVAGPSLIPPKFSEKTRKVITTNFRKNHPVTAARCDIMVNMMGIGSLNALKAMEFGNLYDPEPHILLGNIAAELKNCVIMPVEVTREFLVIAANAALIPRGRS